MGERIDEGTEDFEFSKQEVKGLEFDLFAFWHDADDHHGAAGFGQFWGLGHGFGDAGAFEHDIGTAGNKGLRVGCPRVTCRGGTDGFGKVAAGGLAGDQDNRAGTGKAGELDAEQTDDAAAKHDDRLAGFDGGDVESVDATGEGFAEGAVIRVQAEGQKEGLFLRNQGVFGKAAVAVNAKRDKILAQVDAPKSALWASAARNVRVGGDALADAKAGDFAAESLDDAGIFVAKGDGWGAGKLALEQVTIGTADAASLDLEENFIGTRHGSGNVANCDFVAGQKSDGLHGSLLIVFAAPV